MISDNPWATAPERLNKFVLLDRQLAGRLTDLSIQRAQEDKLAFALEAGRIYGLRSRKCYVLLRKELVQDFSPAPVERSW